MKELLDRLSSYNLLNYLLPGTIFAVLIQQVTPYRIVQTDVVLAAFVYYFVGLVISRIGSVFVEPIMKKTKLVVFAPYNEFVRVAAVDPKLEVLSEQNNTYRTLCALFLTLAGAKVYDIAARRLAVPDQVNQWLLIGALLVLFAFGYRKQTKYIKDRVESREKEHREVA